MSGDVTVTKQPLSVEIVTSWDDFLALRAPWNALVEAVRDLPFVRHDYLRIWIESFAPDAELRCLVARDGEGKLTAALPLLSRRGSILRWPTREWCSPTDVHSFRFDLIALEPATASRAFLERLLAEPEWEVLRIADVPADGAAWEMYRQARHVGLPGGVYVAQRSPFLALPGSVEQMRAGWTSKWRSNLARRRRLLERRGRMSCSRQSGSDGLDELLERCFEIEYGGWKGRRGEPANADPRLRAFYRSLAFAAAAEGNLSLDFLELDGRPVAFHFGITRAGVYSLLWTSYDESFRDASPGHLLTEQVLERCVASGIEEFDFLGCDLEWKRAWTKSAREHSWLYLFRDTASGSFLARAKFGWGPAVRRLLRSPRS